MSSVDWQHSKRTDVSEPKQMSLFYVVIPLGNIIEKVRRCEDQRKIAVKTDRKNKPCTPYLRPKPKDQEVKTMRQCTKCKVTKEYSEFYKRHAFCKGCHKIYNAWTRLKKNQWKSTIHGRILRQMFRWATRIREKTNPEDGIKGREKPNPLNGQESI